MSQADTEQGQDRYLSSEEERTPSPVPGGGQISPLSPESAPSPCSRQPECQESTTPREAGPPNHHDDNSKTPRESPPPCESPPARHRQVLPPPSPFDAGAAAALSSFPTPSSAAAAEEEQPGAWQQPSPPSSPTHAAGQEAVVPFSPFDAETPHPPRVVLAVVALPPSDAGAVSSHAAAERCSEVGDRTPPHGSGPPTGEHTCVPEFGAKYASKSGGGSAAAEQRGDTLQGSPPPSPPPAGKP